MSGNASPNRYISVGSCREGWTMFDKLKNHQENSICDAALAEIAEGKMEALSVIYRIFAKQIFSITYQITKSCEDSEDLLQEVMIAISKNAEKYEQGTNPKAWIMTIARNLAISGIRARKDNVPLDTLEDKMNLQAEESENHMQHLIITDALSSLPPEDQLIVKLKIYIGLSHGEIAEVMDISKSASEKRFERALKKVRLYFGERNNDL